MPLPVKLEGNVIELGLCEYQHLHLRPNQLYRFIVMPECSKCEAEAAIAKLPDTSNIIERMTI
jgi:hypothetical protein